jgi:hypothetical protein
MVTCDKSGFWTYLCEIYWSPEAGQKFVCMNMLSNIWLFFLVCVPSPAHTLINYYHPLKMYFNFSFFFSDGYYRSEAEERHLSRHVPDHQGRDNSAAINLVSHTSFWSTNRETRVVKWEIEHGPLQSIYSSPPEKLVFGRIPTIVPQTMLACKNKTIASRPEKLASRLPDPEGTLPK